MNIQYYHGRRFNEKYEGQSNLCPTGGITIAMEELQPWFFESLKVGEFFDKRVGKAKCSNKDNYCKKTGREFSSSRLKVTKLTVTQVWNLKDGSKTVKLIDPSGCSYQLTKYPHATRVYFEEYHE